MSVVSLVIHILAWRHTVLDIDIADIPKDKGHGTSRLGSFLFDIIPSIPIPINSSCPISIYVDSMAANDEPSMMVLKCNGI
jgi:hypothetical protein